MTDDAPGFAPLSSDDFDTLLEGPNAAESLEAFFDKGYASSMSRFKDALRSQNPWQKMPDPTAPFSSKNLVPPPKRRTVETPKTSHVKTVTDEPQIPEKESVEIPLRPIDKRPIQQVKFIQKEETKQHDTGRITPQKKTSKEQAPITASMESEPTPSETPKLRNVSGEFLEQKLKQRQDKLGDIFKDKGTLS